CPHERVVRVLVVSHALHRPGEREPAGDERDQSGTSDRAHRRASLSAGSARLLTMTVMRRDATTLNHPSLSAVIPATDRPATLSRSLEAIRNANAAPEEVV